MINVIQNIKYTLYALYITIITIITTNIHTHKTNIQRSITRHKSIIGRKAYNHTHTINKQHTAQYKNKSNKNKQYHPEKTIT